VDLEFLKAKNGEDTLKINSLFLHSSYNPSKEAERFVQNIKTDFSPVYILIVEPGLGFSFPFLKQRFPQAKIGCVRFIKTTDHSPFDFDIQFNENYTSFYKEIQKIIPTEFLFNTLFLSWEPAAKIFTQENELIWNHIISILENEKTLLITRQYFEKKWLINSCNFVKYSKHFVTITKKIDSPIVICASGPSLKSVLPTLKSNNDNIFIICLSSAVSVLKKNNIKPDLYLSTDGGYWANRHLRKMENDVPLAITPESFVNKQILNSHNIFPLTYSDGLSSHLSEIYKNRFFPAERNGTVSGTAIKLAENLSSNSQIYFCGLDLCSNKEFQHTQPNELEIANASYDNRINPSEKRNYGSSLPNQSLKFYEDWFKNEQFSENSFRVIDFDERKNDLNNLKDISPKDFASNLDANSKKKENYFSKFLETNKETLCNSYKDFLIDQLENQETIKNIFSLDYVALLRNPESEEFKSKISNEKQDLIKKIERIFNE